VDHRRRGGRGRVRAEQVQFVCGVNRRPHFQPEAAPVSSGLF
jgi:hypothetical protein